MRTVSALSRRVSVSSAPGGSRCSARRSSRCRVRTRSTQQRRVSWPIHGRIAASFQRGERSPDELRDLIARTTRHADLADREAG